MFRVAEQTESPAAAAMESFFFFSKYGFSWQVNKGTATCRKHSWVCGSVTESLSGMLMTLDSVATRGWGEMGAIDENDAYF